MHFLFSSSRNRRNQPIVILIHGFGTKTDHELEPLAVYLRNNGFDVYNFAYFDPKDQSDIHFENWIERCEGVVRRYIAQSRPIYLVGFSMGGVIASYLASVFPVKGMVLTAPAFYPFDFSKVEKAGKKVLTSGGSSSMSSAQTRAFISLVSRYRSSITQVDCPVLIIHGTEDEVIQLRSSQKAIEQIHHSQKYLLSVHGAKHRLLYDGPFEALVFPMIRDFLKGEIFPL